MNFTGRSEADVFADLAILTAQSGYIHAIAQICHRDDLVVYAGEYKASDLSHMFNYERLIRTEINTLLGLMMRQSLDLTLPTAETMQAHISRTDELMKELHDALNRPMFESMIGNFRDGKDPSDIWSGSMMREPIFYGSESAYSFQYRDLFLEKHRPDDNWLQENMGFTSAQAKQVARTMCSLMDERATATFAKNRQGGQRSLSLLSHFEFTPEEIAQRSRQSIEVVQAIFMALTLTTGNSQFNELGDFNAVAATPLLPTDRGSVLLFQHYAIYEALYESPFFWMWNDKAYKQTAMDNRGAFAEKFSSRRLAAVFGQASVHANVNIYQGKDTVGEADVLVVFGDRIIIVQAKAKKLTLAARKGNDGQLKSDFAAAIQKAYDQGLECANAILTGNCRLVDDQGREVKLPESIKEISPFCVVSDHYPALAFQASQFLKHQTTDVIQPPFVMDVFLLDVLAEMLDTPLRFLSYVRLRAAATGKLSVNHELTALAYHLQRNLWLAPDFNMVMLEDSIAAELDTAMTVRREGFPGKRTPSGILTKMAGTLYESLITQIERRADPAILELGFALLSMDEESCQSVHRGLLGITHQAKLDGKRHDFVIGVSSHGSGICFHCNPSPNRDAIDELQVHCQKRKYSLHARTWFGVSLSPDADIQFGVTLDFAWSQSREMDQLTKDMKAPTSVKAALKTFERNIRPKKCGRNQACPCGSGKKYKKCCSS